MAHYGAHLAGDRLQAPFFRAAGESNILGAAGAALLLAAKTDFEQKVPSLGALVLTLQDEERMAGVVLQYLARIQR